MNPVGNIGQLFSDHPSDEVKVERIFKFMDSFTVSVCSTDADSRSDVVESAQNLVNAIYDDKDRVEDLQKSFIEKASRYLREDLSENIKKEISEDFRNNEYFLKRYELLNGLFEKEKFFVQPDKVTCYVSAPINYILSSGDDFAISSLNSRFEVNGNEIKFYFDSDGQSVPISLKLDDEPIKSLSSQDKNFKSRVLIELWKKFCEIKKIKTDSYQEINLFSNAIGYKAEEIENTFAASASDKAILCRGEHFVVIKKNQNILNVYDSLLSDERVDVKREIQDSEIDAIFKESPDDCIKREITQYFQNIIETQKSLLADENILSLRKQAIENAISIYTCLINEISSVNEFEDIKSLVLNNNFQYIFAPLEKDDLEFNSHFEKYYQDLLQKWSKTQTYILTPIREA